ncbi:hypothetical protein I4U23_016785 [Adineta vaga]|nr:hypothetical protein I4U23_016785 [Adineta vaga]
MVINWQIRKNLISLAVYIRRLPNESALRLLLICGSHWLDFNTTEPIHYDTPFHIICKRDQNKKIIKLLLNSGCHMDCVNKSGKIPLDYINDKKIQTLFTTPFPLKCLCARIIVNKYLYTTTLNKLTSTLKKFIFLHDSLHIDLILK